MNLNQKQSSIQQQISKPNPPTPEMVKRAQFVDKTYHWKNAGIRPGEQRTSK
jgi:hypothetical protein